MTISKDEFWGANTYNNPPLTDELIKLAEETLGVKLPEEYLELIRIQNGGLTRDFAFPIRGTHWSDDHVPFEELSGITSDADIQEGSLHNILLTDYMSQEWGLPPKQVLLAGDGHTWITLDYRVGDLPSVSWIDVECEEEVSLAPSFAEFISALRPMSEFVHDE